VSSINVAARKAFPLAATFQVPSPTEHLDTCSAIVGRHCSLAVPQIGSDVQVSIGFLHAGDFLDRCAHNRPCLPQSSLACVGWFGLRLHQGSQRARV